MSGLTPVASPGASSQSRLSAELFTIPLDDGKFLVYAPLRQAAFVTNAAAINLIADLRDGTADTDAAGYAAFVEFLRRLEIVDAGEERLPVTTFHGVPEPTAVTLFLTTACNLRCTYCYASAGDTPAKRMALETATRGIAFVIANAARLRAGSIEVNYHGGGEPSANWLVMTESLAYARREAAAAGLTVRASAATNGVLSETQADWMIANLDGVSLSFDGLPETHDRHRLTVNGTGSSAIVMTTIRRFDAAGFPYGLRVTVTADQIPNLAASIEFIFRNFKPLRVQVEPAYALGRWKEAPTAETEDFIAAFREAQQIARSVGREIDYSAARLGTLSNHFCGVTQDTFALSTDGQVSACYEVFADDNPLAKTFFYGKPVGRGSDYRFELPVLNNLRQQAVQHKSFCQGCYAKWTCAGDCHHKALTVTPGEEFSGSDRCHITREITKDQILARIEQSGGHFWHEARPLDEDRQAKGKEMLL